jgi:hypothetical protein
MAFIVYPIVNDCDSYYLQKDLRASRRNSTDDCGDDYNYFNGKIGRHEPFDQQ